MINFENKNAMAKRKKVKKLENNLHKTLEVTPSEDLKEYINAKIEQAESEEIIQEIRKDVPQLKVDKDIHYGGDVINNSNMTELKKGILIKMGIVEEGDFL